MAPIHLKLKAKIGPDGVLHLDVPFGTDEADHEVDVMLSVRAARPEMTQEEWHKFIEETAGSITDPTFRRHEQGEFEQRDELW